MKKATPLKQTSFFSAIAIANLHFSSKNQFYLAFPFESIFSRSQINAENVTHIDNGNVIGNVPIVERQLKWNTPSENETDSFTIERSAGGQNFAAIGNTKSTGAATYNLANNHPIPVNAYYRLRQTDSDGDYTNRNVPAEPGERKQIQKTVLQYQWRRG